MLSLRRLEHFAIIAEEKSFLKAAVRLNLTQPALTHSIQTLEESFGLQLFNRAHDGTSLTDAGQRLLPSALRTLAGADSLKREAFELLSVDAGHVNFGVGVFPASTFLTRLLIDQQLERPNLTIDVDIGNWHRLRAKLERSELDFVVALTHSLPPSTEFIVQPLPSQRFGFFVRKGHPLLGLDASVQRKSLKEFKLIGPFLPDQARMALKDIYQLERPQDLPFGLSCDNVAVLRDVMLSSDCVLFGTHEAMFSSMASCETLAHVQYAEAQLLITTVIYARGRALSPSALWLINKIKQVAAYP